MFRCPGSPRFSLITLITYITYYLLTYLITYYYLLT